ncbi:MAG TPA: FG-GAP-like repeat-containing protein [Bryobacteraceae bacterium]|nr:FG-GAP-like repeat-containing protein [Bryobacteraceae bacterium]
MKKELLALVDSYECLSYPYSVAVPPIGRREFLAALASSGLFVPSRSFSATRYPVRFRKPSPYESVLAHTEPGTDEFPFEKEAQEIEQRLRAALRGTPLQLSDDFRGASPMPLRYKSMADGVSVAEFGSADGFHSGLAHWIASLGHLRRSAFFVLPRNIVRYEIAGDGAYRVGFWKQVWKNGRLAEFSPLSETLVTAKEPLFHDITAHAFHGVTSFDEQLLKGNVWWRSRLDSATGIDIYGNNGVAVGDIDNDGWDEIYVCQPGGLPNRLYKNRGDGTLVDITEKAGVGVLDDTTCALFADFRNSGRQDLAVLRSAGPLLFLNQGDGTFTHAPDAFRFRADPQGSFTGMAAADYNRDGRLDLYLCTYIYFQSEDQYRYPAPYHDAENGPPNFLFRNELTASGGYFEDVTNETGLDQNNHHYSFAPAWCDFDGDGWPDLYVANDFGKSNLYRNRGGKFHDEAGAAGVENMAPGMSAAWFDYDGDGRPDLYVSNMWTEAGQRVVDDPAFSPGRDHRAAFHSHTKGSSLFRNLGDGKFEETSAPEGVAMGRWAWSADGLDFDNDGAPEIFITTGMLTNPSEKDLNSFFWRQVVAKSPPADQPAPDYENGWNAINQLIRENYSWCGREPNVFYKRVTPAAGGAAKFYDFSGVSGLDFADDSRAFAATDIDNDGNLDIVLKSRLGPQVRILRNNCGIGKRSIALRLRGTKSNRDAIGARVEVNGRVQYLSAGSGYLSQHSKQLHFGLQNANEATAAITWPSGATQQFSKLRAGFRYEIEEGSDHVEATPFRPRASMPAAPVEGVNQPDFASTWLIDPPPLPEKRKGPGFLLLTAGAPPSVPSSLPFEVVDVSRSSPDLAAYYSVFHRYLFELRTDLELPLLLLVDDRSHAQKIYAEIPSADVLDRDLKTLVAGRGPDMALPFPGLYYLTPRRNYFKLGAAFYWAGYPDQAIPYLDEVVHRHPDHWKAHLALSRIHYEAERWKPALEEYKQVLAIRPEHADALLGAGDVCLKLNDLPAAENFLRRAADADPQNADAANQLGLTFARQNRTAEAKPWFERAISLKRDHTGAINNLGVLYAELGQRDDAIAAFRYGIGIAPDNEELYLNLGRVYVQMGEREKARDLMRQLLAKKPASQVAVRALRELDSRE